MISKKLKEIVLTIKNFNDYPKLKKVVLAQSILESGWGRSRLVEMHNNTHGMKWRKWMKGYATPVMFKTSHDAPGPEGEKYCKFETIEGSIKGYFHRLDWSPYEGWKKYKEKPVEFIRFIGPIWCPGNGYIEKVVELFDEAEELLEKETLLNESEIKIEKPTDKDKLRLAFFIGHTPDDKGAYGIAPIGKQEFDWNLELSEIIKRYAEKHNFTLKVFANNKPTRPAIEEIVQWNPDCCIELHFNATAGAKGTETLYCNKLPESEIFASIVQEHVCKVFERIGRENRGLKVRDKQAVDWNEKPRAFWNCYLGTYPNCLIEPFFGDTQSEANIGEAKKEEYAKCLVDACEEFFKAKKAGVTGTIQPPKLMSRPFIKITKTDKEFRGLTELKASLIGSDGKELDFIPCYSGAPGKQNFRIASVSISGSFEPAPEGYYKLGPLEWKGGVGNYSASWGKGLGPLWVDILPDKGMKTERSALGFHLDENVSHSPGSAGCCVFKNKEDLKSFVSWFQDPRCSPKKMIVDYGYGTVKDREKEITERADWRIICPPDNWQNPLAISGNELTKFEIVAKSLNLLTNKDRVNRKFYMGLPIVDGIEPRTNRNGEIVKDIPSDERKEILRDYYERDGNPWIYPGNTRYEADPDFGELLKTTGNKPQGIVIHHTVSYNTQGTINQFKNNSVDIHFIAGHRGEVIQMVPCNRIAAHAGKSSWNEFNGLNDYFIGIEVVNIGPLVKVGEGYLDWYNHKKYKKGESYKFWDGEVKELHTQGYKYWEPFTEAQERAVTEIVRWAMQSFEISVDNVIGHYECSPGRKNDPAGGFSYGSVAKYREYLKKPV